MWSMLAWHDDPHHPSKHIAPSHLMGGAGSARSLRFTPYAPEAMASSETRVNEHRVSGTALELTHDDDDNGTRLMVASHYL